MKPALEEDILDKRILRDFDEIKNKSIANVLIALLPKSIIGYVIEQAGLSGDKKVNSISVEERRKIIFAIKNLSFEVEGLCNIESAVVTAGGIDVNEINPNSMESKLVKNLYFCGEVMDVDALTGGFNLQIAFSTGVLAGKLKGAENACN